MTSNWGTQSKYGEYEIAGAREGRPRLLGEGSFGKTFEALRTDRIGGKEIRKRVAIKVLNPEILTSEAKRFQFIQELDALTEFQHSNLIHYIRCGEEHGEVYYAMDLCRGGDLAGLVRRYGGLPERVAALIGGQIAAGLREVHQKHRLVHRDIKPSNVMLADELEPELERAHLAFRFEQQESLCRVVDFGLVNFAMNAETAGPRFAGSPMYASPEQIREQPVDGRADIYALGMTLWYLVQGKGPLLDAEGGELKDMRAALGRHLGPESHDAEFPTRLSPQFRAILARMVAKQPSERFATAAELQGEIREYLSSTTVETEPAFALTRVAGPLDSVFELEERIPSRGSQASYVAREKASGERVKVSIVASVEGVEGGSAPQETNALAERLRSLAELSRQPTIPAALLPVRSVVWAADLLAYAEEMLPQLALAEVLKARANARRPIGFTEATAILRPIAEALDFMLQHGERALSLPCEEVWLASSSVDALPLDPEILIAPLTSWEGLQVYFSMIYLPPAAEAAIGSAASFGQTMSGSFQLSEAELHPVPAFARLVYRIINGSEVATAVQFTPHAYVPAVTLGHASNNLLRDVLSQQRPWESATAVLKELCGNEGVVWRSAAHSTTARTAPGAAPSTGSQGVSGSHAERTRGASPPRDPLPATAPGASTAATWREPAVAPQAHATTAALPLPAREAAAPVPDRRLPGRPKWPAAAAIGLGLIVTAGATWHFLTPAPRTAVLPAASFLSPTPAPAATHPEVAARPPDPPAQPGDADRGSKFKTATETTPAGVAPKPAAEEPPAPSAVTPPIRPAAPEQPAASVAENVPAEDSPRQRPPQPGLSRPQRPPSPDAPAWLFPDSSEHRLSAAQLAGLDKTALWRARNEIFARHGYIFSTEAGRALTASLGAAYQPVTANMDAVSDSLNATEQANVELLKSLENAPRGNGNGSGSGLWLFPDSAARALSKAELTGLDHDALWRARNEIYARHGLIFNTERGRAFAKSLGANYRPSTASPEAVERSFNPAERANVDLLKKMEGAR
jgi:serine/threonine protein kinase